LVLAVDQGREIGCDRYDERGESQYPGARGQGPATLTTRHVEATQLTVDEKEDTTDRRGTNGTEEHGLRELMPLHDRRRARGVLRREEVGFVRANDGNGREGGRREQTGDEPAIVREHDVGGEGHDPYGHCAPRKGEEQRRGQDRHGGRGNDPHRGRLSFVARQRQAEDQPHHGQETKRIPVGQRKTETAGQKPGRDLENVG